ncbi:tail fiber protein [Escherichia phage HZ2R8]|uniref:Tail fiber protein n=1 Tax=Escherichia phage HZ2R8 TaxID=2079317 RepID=A0A2K9VJZ6_9CAUD|nr:tail fiber protein [Escherichia phage HZ2R8]AUV62662.1 tail fiber protein [Escherichia phage HZ2R8]
MANVIKTVLTYQLDGSNRDFNIPFEYLARKFVVVTLIGVDRKVLTLNTDYRFATRTTISLTKSWGPADGYTTIELRRVTSTTDRLVDFTDGSILRAYDLNVAQIQTMHVAEEARDLTADTIGVNNDGHLDARGRRIVNLANAVDDRDAVPLGQLKTMNQNSWQARNETLQFRNDAEGFRNDAERFMNSASASSDSANSAKDAAHQSNVEAYQHRLAAETAKTAAQQSNVESYTWSNKSKEYAESASMDAAKAEQQANRAKTEADKLANTNAFAATLKTVQGGTVEWHKEWGLKANSFDALSDITALNGTMNSMDVRASRNVAVAGVTYPQGGIQQTIGTNQWNHLVRLHINGRPSWVGDKQGLHLAWNENGSGEADLICNQGAGAGGFLFRTVNDKDNVEIGRVTFTGAGAVHANHFQVGHSRMESNGNVVAGSVLYAGNGSSQMAPDGNVHGPLWGGWLSSYLNNRYLFAKPPGGVQLFTSRGGDYLEGVVDNQAVGFRWFLSDRRLKENINVLRSADDMLNIIRSYIPVTYKYKDSEYTDNRGRTITVTGKKSRAGFITQDLIRIWPEAVDVLSDGMQSPDPNQIIGGLMLLVKNLDERVQELEKKNNV